MADATFDSDRERIRSPLRDTLPPDVDNSRAH